MCPVCPASKAELSGSWYSVVWLCDENQDEAFATDDLHFKGLSDRGVAGAKVIEAQKKKKKKDF